MAKFVNVKAIGIKNISSGHGEGTNLEIYGHLSAHRVVPTPDGIGASVQDHFFFNRDNNNSLEVSGGATLLLNEVALFGLEPGEFLRIGGHLKEHDPADPNDSLGNNYRDLFFDVIASGPLNIRFEETGQIVDALYELTVT
jgi:hypothetical protein